MKNKKQKLRSILLCTLVLASGISIAGATRDSNEFENFVENIGNIKLGTYSHPLSGNGDILYVGGSGANNYSTIQSAIDNASSEDTIFVYDDSSPYYENVVIDKSIQLIGENKITTVINGNDSGDVVTISADNVNISSFTIKDSGDLYSENNAGIKLLSDENVITDMNITTNLWGIFLQSSNRNIIVYNAINYNRDGIRLVDASTQNVISENTLVSWSFDFNIYIRNSSNNNIISQNTIINYDGWGIYIFESQENNISNNSVMNCEDGISLVRANNTIVSNNSIQHNEDGVSISNSIEVSVLHNTFVNDGLFIWDSFHNTVFDNTVDGKPLVYLEDESDVTISSDAGQIILINCSCITIKNQDIRDTNVGIELWGSDNCEISQNTLTHNRRNLYLHDANFNTVQENTLKSNKSYSFKRTLELNNCIGNRIIENDISTTDYRTYVLITKSHENTISKNSFSGESIKLGLSYSDDNTIIGNTFSSGRGMSLSSCDNNKVLGNSITDGNLGIGASRKNIISGNTISNSDDEWGVIIDGSYRNIITRNTIENCKGGFSLSGSRFNVISKNNIIDCGSTPAWFSNSLINRWSRNYWGQPLLRPKIIPGEIRIPRSGWPWPPPDIVIPVFRLDLFPRLFPHP